MKTKPIHRSASFQTTRWSLVLLAQATEKEEARQALATLCEAYWYPIYAFIRSSGRSPHDAEDLTQGFFARLLEKGTLAHADPARGRLRSFLLTCVRNHLHNEHDRAAAKRRGAHLLARFDPGWAEERYASEPVDHLSPDRLYQRRWALTLLESTLLALEKEHAAEGRAGLFATLRPFLGFGKESLLSYDDLALRLGANAATLRTQVSRLRQRWRELLFEQVSLTLDDPTSDEIKAELSELIGCV